MSSSSFPEKSIFICDGSKCGDHKAIRKYFKEAIKENGLKNEVEIFKIECSDRCKHAPVMCVQPENKWFDEVSLKKAHKIFQEYILT